MDLLNPRRALLLAALLAVAGCSKPAFNAVDVTGAGYGQKLALPDADGKTRTLADFKGKVTVVFFGYTQCPDVCPGTLAELAQVKRSLGADGQRLQVVFVTVDPERDTPQVLKGYVSQFDPSFVALRGTLDETRAVVADFKAAFAKVPGKAEGSYTVDHTAGSYVFDAQGRLRLFTRYGQGPQALASDLKILLNEA